MNSVIMDNVEIGDNCVIGALSLITEGAKIPERKVVVGNPAKIIKDVSDEMLLWKTRGTMIYQQLTEDCHTQMKESKALKKSAKREKKQKGNYKTWKKTKK